LTESKSLEEALADAFQRADSLESPLGKRLEFYLGESRKLLPDLEATYDELVARLRSSQSQILVPAVGERLPDFVMSDSEGHLVELSALLRKASLVVSFNRGPWCDYCGLELHALARDPEIVAADADVVSIVPETQKYALKLRQSRRLPFRVLTDLDLAYALSLGLVFWVGDTIKDAYRRFGIDLERFQGHGGWLLPIPATLVLNREGLVKARFVDPDFRHRMATADILSVLAQAD
jgi:peroxiredoxin